MANIQNNWLNYFTRVNRSEKCKFCDETCSRDYAPAHLYRRHNITDQEVILHWNNNNDLIWQHFFKKNLFCAECKHCGMLLTSAYHKKNLEKIIRIKTRGNVGIM